MYPPTFDYIRAESVEHAIQLLGDHEDAKLLAGGHSLLPMMKLRLAMPPTVIDIGRVATLRGVTVDGGTVDGGTVDGGTVRIGALTTHAEVADSADVQQHAPVLAEAAAKIGDPAVRNRGTVGGNIAHADPASDLPAVLLALGATVHLQSADGARTVAAADFFTGLLETDLKEGEVLVAVSFEALASGNDGSAYLKVEHAASGYAVCGAAAVIRGDQVSLAYNGVTAVPHHAGAVSDALSGSDLADGTIDAAIDGHLDLEDPLSDVQADAAYRAHLAAVYGKRALKAARDRRG